MGNPLDVEISDGANFARKARLDSVQLALLCNDVVHGHIHDGHHFEVHVESGASTVASLICAFKVPVTSPQRYPHIVIDWKASDRAYIDILEGATWTTNTGTVKAISNNHRVSSNTSILQEDKTATPAWTANGVLADPSGVSGGTSLHQDEAYSSAPFGTAISLPRHEWILDVGTYVIQIVKRAAGNIYMGIVLHWYEIEHE